MLLLLFSFAFSALSADAPKLVTVPYYEPGGTRLKAIFTGNGVGRTPDGLLLVTNFMVRALRDGDRNQTDFVAEAPEAVFDRNTFEAFSDGPVRFRTGNTNFTLTGVGFLWRQTNGVLFVSNNVATTIVRPRAQGEQPVLVRSDRLRFDEPTRQAFYADNVRVDDPGFAMTSGQLVATLGAGNSLSRLEAADNVVFNGRQDGSRATADHAVYLTEGGREVVELTGNPTWQDLQRQSRAQRYLIDRTARTLRAEADAWIRLPRETLSQPGGFMAAKNVPAKPAPGSQTNFVEIAAGMIFVEMPPTNGSPRHILAETNVVIATADGRSRATSARADFSDATGDLVLTGDAEWHIEETLVRGDKLTANRATRALDSSGNAFLRTHLPSTTSDGGASLGSTNLFAEITAPRFHSEGGSVEFGDGTVIKVLEDDVLAGQMDCRRLKATFNADKELQGIEAVESVYARQFPVNGRTNFLVKDMRTERLTAKFTPMRTLQTLSADGGVLTEQRSLSSKGGTNFTTTHAETTIAWFAASNVVERFVARQNVRMTHNNDQVEGRQAVYLGTNGVGVLEVSGQPWAVQNGNQIRDAEALLWDQKTEKITARGLFTIEGVETNSPPVGGK